MNANALSDEPETEPLTPRIGAIVHGVDLNTISERDAARIRDALLARRVVFFRNQQVSTEGHVAFARALGPLTRAHPILPASDEDQAVFELDSQAGSAANHWHTDVTFVIRPPTFSILHALVVPPVGGDTMWANTVAGYADLRPTIRALADELRAVHTNGHDYGRADVASSGQARPEQIERLRRFASSVYETEHPVVRLHPETGERALLLGGFAQKLVGHGSTETVDLVRTLQSYVTRPENTVRWRWEAGDVAVWDNRSTQHYAISDYGEAHRKMQRVTTAGEVPVGLDGRPSLAIAGDDRHYYFED